MSSRYMSLAFTEINGYIPCGQKKSLWIDLGEKSLRNSKYFLIESFSLYIHIHIIVKKLELSKLHIEIKVWGSKHPEDGLFKKSSLFKKRHIFCPFLFLYKNLMAYKNFALYFKWIDQIV